tara:strand:+ start:1204 stop:1584 length:381 start_codon:yes stop_codon:yes gene_type:complete
MFYEELFDIEDEYENRPQRYKSGFGAISELKQEKKFYRLYSAITECHVIMIKNQMYEHTLYDINSMKPSDKILEISHKNIIHFFDIDSFMQANINNHSLVLVNTKNKKVEFIPAQLRSMITDGCIS